MKKEATIEWSDEWSAAPYDESLLVAVLDDEGGEWLQTGWLNSDENGLWITLPDGLSLLVEGPDGDPVKEDQKGSCWAVAWSLPPFPV
jgi:hypothetical protein